MARNQGQMDPQKPGTGQDHAFQGGAEAFGTDASAPRDMAARNACADQQRTHRGSTP
jgi:hypothetical protein